MGISGCCDNCHEPFPGGWRVLTAEKAMVCRPCADELPACRICRRVMIQTPAQGMNLPNVTEGPQYWCHECYPPGNAAEVVESFINPPTEMLGDGE